MKGDCIRCGVINEDIAMLTLDSEDFMPSETTKVFKTGDGEIVKLKEGDLYWICLNNGCNVRVFVEEMPVDELVRKYGEVVRKSDKVEIPVEK